MLGLTAGLLLIQPTLALGGALCPGKYNVLPLGPWPTPVALNVLLLTNSAAGETRASALRAGIQQSGLQLDAVSPIALQLVFSVASSGGQEDVYSGLEWHRVDSEFGTSLKDRTLPNSSLSMTAIVNDNGGGRNIWVATMHCTIKTDDSEALAREIGLDLGQAISSSIRPSR